MECVNFDERFERFASRWMQENAAKYKNNIARMEAAIPDVYLKWLNKPADWLGGIAPSEYFLQYHDAEQLSKWIIAYLESNVPVPDQLLERITSLGKDGEQALLRLMETEGVPEEACLIAINLLSEMESNVPMMRYVSWIALREERDDRADLAAEALTAMGAAIVGPVLEIVQSATESGKETFADVLCNYPGDPRIYDLTLYLFKKNPKKIALYASLLGKLGDERAIPILVEATKDDSLNYLDFIELRNAIEALGAEAPSERTFDGDPYYESLRRMD